jgi:hypothetical protein
VSKRNKKYNPKKGLKLSAVGAEFGSMSDDLDHNSNMVVRCDSKKMNIRDQAAISFPQKWFVTIAVFLKSQNGDLYQEVSELEFKTEHYLEEIIKEQVPPIALELLDNINPNHFVNWGWHAEVVV